MKIEVSGLKHVSNQVLADAVAKLPVEELVTLGIDAIFPDEDSENEEHRDEAIIVESMLRMAALVGDKYAAYNNGTYYISNMPLSNYEINMIIFYEL